MHTLRTDPEGAWRNREVHDRPSDMQIALDLHPGEASWQASVTENTFGIVKDTTTRIVLERSDLNFNEVVAAAVLVHNEMERVRGFSAAQGMETARDAWVKARNEERLKRAPRSRKQALSTFQTW